MVYARNGLRVNTPYASLDELPLATISSRGRRHGAWTCNLRLLRRLDLIDQVDRT